jgi:hypothetical protein
MLSSLPHTALGPCCCCEAVPAHSPPTNTHTHTQTHAHTHTHTHTPFCQATLAFAMLARTAPLLVMKGTPL